jgi:hypothetical protein
VPEECCSHVCVANPNSPTGYACVGACLPLSGQDCSSMSCGAGTVCVNNLCVNQPPCSADADCCNGATCQNGNCVSTGQSCVQLGGSCTNNSDCCNGNCAGGFCARTG